jgi:hypothetical protein
MDEIKDEITITETIEKKVPRVELEKEMAKLEAELPEYDRLVEEFAKITSKEKVARFDEMFGPHNYSNKPRIKRINEIKTLLGVK